MHLLKCCRSIYVAAALCCSIGVAVVPQASKAQGATPVEIVAPLPIPVALPAQIAVNIVNINAIAMAIAQQINNIHPQVNVANINVVAQQIAQQIAAVQLNTNIVNVAVIAQQIAQQIRAVNLNANIVNINALAVAIAQQIVAVNLNANIVNVNAIAVAIAQQIAAVTLNTNIANVNALAVAVGQQVVIAARQEKTLYDARQEMDFPDGTANITLSFPAVPANATLVIQFVTVKVILPNGQVVDDLEIGTQLSTASALIYHILTLPDIVTAVDTLYSTSQPLDLYAGPSTTVQVTADRTVTTGAAHLIVTITGYLIPNP